MCTTNSFQKQRLPYPSTERCTQVKPVAFLQGILAWEQDRAIVVDLRLRAILEGLKRYVEDFKIAWSFRRRLQPLVQSKVKTLTTCLKKLRIQIASHPDSSNFPFETEERPPPMDICIPSVLEKFMYIIQYLGRVPYPPILDTKFGTSMSGSRPVWHPSLCVVLSSIVFKLRDDVGALNDNNFQCALHLTIWLLGMAGEKPFRNEKDNELVLWNVVAALLNVDSVGCRQNHVEYLFG